MSTQSLFNTVERLRAQRKADEQQYLQSLTGRGKAGYAIGKALGGLLGGSTTDPEMLQAQREQAYAQQFMMEQDPAQKAAMLQGGYALSPDFGRKLEALQQSEAAAQTEALKTQLEMENIRSQIAERAAKTKGEKPVEIKAPNKTTIAAYESLLKSDPGLSALVEPLTDWTPAMFGGSKLSSSELNDLLIERANTIRQQTKGTSLRDSMRMAIEEYTTGATAPQQTMPTDTTAPQQSTAPAFDLSKVTK